jgi:hypothetical protein
MTGTTVAMSAVVETGGLGMATVGTTTVGMATGGTVGGTTGPSTAMTGTTVAMGAVVGIGGVGMVTVGTMTVGMATGGTVGEHLRHERRIIRHVRAWPADSCRFRGPDPAYCGCGDGPVS